MMQVPRRLGLFGKNQLLQNAKKQNKTAFRSITRFETPHQNKKLTLDVMKLLPKAELHCHIDGSIPVETIIELARKMNVQLPTYDVEKLRSLVCVSDNCSSLVEYLRGFEITNAVTQEKYGLTRCVYQVCEEAYKDGVRYIELRFSPSLHTNNGLSLSSIMEAVVEGLTMAELNLKLTARIIVCGMRHMSSSVTRQLAEIAWRYQDRGVVAFDLAGPEDGFSSVLHKEAIELIHRKMLNCTLHSGEAASWVSVHDSLRYCGAHRIGHGVRMRENPTLEQFVANTRIPIEVCVTSNIQTKCVSSIQDHPIREFFDKGIVVVPCTDNMVVSNVTLSSEYIKIQDNFGFSVQEIVRLIDYGFRSAFLDLSTKKRLRAEAMHSVMKILNEKGYNVKDIFAATSHLDVGLEFPHLNAQEIEIPMIASSVPHHEQIACGFTKSMPKADLNCRFGGSVTIDTLWNLLTTDKETYEYLKQQLQLQNLNTAEILASKNNFTQIIQKKEHTKESTELAQNVMSMILQTKSQLEAAVDDILQTAADDNIVYMELHLRPSLHSRRQLSAESVVQIVSDRIQHVEKQIKQKGKNSFRCRLVLYVDSGSDGYEQIQQTALLAVKFKDQIAGFGFYGAELGKNHPYNAVFNILKDNQIMTTAVAARDDYHSVIPAIHDADASRLSGAFKAHESPKTMAYLANHGIPVEIALTDVFKASTADIKGFASSLVRLYFDRGVKLVIGSFDFSLYPQSRSEMICQIASEGKMTFDELIQLLGAGFKYSFQPYWEKRKMYEEFYKQASEQAAIIGVKHVHQYSYFPDSLKSCTTSAN